MLDSITRCWESSQFHQTTLIDALISYKLLNYRMVINWVFLQIERGVEQSEYCKKYWEILLNTITKILIRSDIAKTELRKVFQLLGEESNTFKKQAKIHNLSDEVPKLQKKLENAVDEEQSMFELVFKVNLSQTLNVCHC